MKVTEESSIYYIGVDDLDIDFFEGQYTVPEGMAYNSYVIVDEKIAIMDTVDERKSAEWQQNLEAVLAGRTPDYLVVQHVEPDHSANMMWLLEKYPSCTLVCSAKARTFVDQFYPSGVKNAVQVVKEGDALSLGSHTLHFYTAPMVHWPEVIVTYEESEKVLFAADGFGKFGALCNETDDWACEARRYYFNICGKYGASVQGLLKKAATLDIQTICPLHGPILKENLGYYIGLYDTWSKYEPETQGVFIAYCSLHGNTKQAALALAAELEAAGQKVTASDLVRTDMAECIEDAFRYDRMVLAAPTYDGAVMPVMEDFLSHLAVKTYRNRTVALVENGTWAPQAAKVMRAKLEQMKDITIVEPVVSIRSAVKPEDLAQLKELAGVLKK
jgi:flavorubredoxin